MGLDFRESAIRHLDDHYVNGCGTVDGRVCRRHAGGCQGIAISASANVARLARYGLCCVDVMYAIRGHVFLLSLDFNAGMGSSKAVCTCSGQCAGLLDKCGGTAVGILLDKRVDYWRPVPLFWLSIS